jgi:hypothetical protein
MVDAKDSSAPAPPKHFADCAEAGKIMYIQQPKGMYSACFGGLMATRLVKCDAAGVAIDGRFRDIQEIQELGLPVSLLPITTHMCHSTDNCKAICSWNFHTRFEYIHKSITSQYTSTVQGQSLDSSQRHSCW